ncbi:hypothetical protein ThvES_00008080 [Thiovulum sp. ES]|nr:hypothetical protein ThvES_00008080 [Thiovulum sp. ES]
MTYQLSVVYIKNILRNLSEDLVLRTDTIFKPNQQYKVGDILFFPKLDKNYLYRVIEANGSDSLGASETSGTSPKLDNNLIFDTQLVFVKDRNTDYYKYMKELFNTEELLQENIQRFIYTSKVLDTYYSETYTDIVAYRNKLYIAINSLDLPLLEVCDLNLLRQEILYPKSIFIKEFLDQYNTIESNSFNSYINRLSISSSIKAVLFNTFKKVTGNTEQELIVNLYNAFNINAILSEIDRLVNIYKLEKEQEFFKEISDISYDVSDTELMEFFNLNWKSDFFRKEREYGKVGNL